MKSKNDGSLIGCLAYLGLIPITALLNGYVLSMLWQWFIVSTFEARPLGVLPAIGVAMVVSFLTKQYDPYTDESKTAGERATVAIGVTFLHPLLALLFGWILHSFM